MRKVVFYLLASAIVGFAASCNRIEQEIIPTSEGVTVLTAHSDDGLVTKTSLDGVNVLWTSSDKITAFDDAGNCYTSTKTELQDESGTVVKFTVPTESPLYAVYPAYADGAEVEMTNGKIAAVIPISQNGISGSFDSGVNVEIAKIDDPDDIHFKNIGGLLAVKIVASEHNINSIKISANEDMTGDILASIDADGTVTTAFSTVEGSEVAKYVDITGEFEAGNTYYAVVAPGTYTNVSIVFTDEDGKTATYAKKTDLVVERNSNQLIGGFSPDNRWESSGPFFYESFDQTTGTGGNDGQWSGSIASSTLTPDNEGWVLSSAGGANKCAKFGTGSAKGFATTPALNITSELATLTFKAGAWNKDKTDLFLSVEGNGVLSEYVVTMLNNEWSNYTVYIAGADKNTKVKFYTEVVSRFFLDEITVVAGGSAFEYLTVPAEVNVTYDATSASFDIKTGSAWTITGAEDVEIDKTSGNGNTTVTLSFPENTTASDITIATLTITAGEKTAELVVKQSGNPDAIEELSIVEFLAKEVGTAYFRLTGTITDIVDVTYGNFTLVDETGSVYVYGLTKTKVASNDKSFALIDVEEGDIVTLEGQRSVHNDTPQVGGPAYYISHIKAPSLSVDPEELVFAAEGGSKSVSVTANYFGDGLTISAVSNNSQFSAAVSGNTITVVASKNTGNEVKTGEITVTATDGTNTKTAKIDVSQNKLTQPAQDGDILWQEDFTGYGTAMPATATGTHVYGGGAVSYSVTNGSSTTKLYNDGTIYAGGDLPELLISKGSGTFVVSGIPTGNATAITLTYKANNDYCVITASNNVTLRDNSTFEDKVKTVYLDVPSGVPTFDLEFKNTNSNNCRVDNFSLTAGAPKVKESQTISFGDDKLIEWVIGTNCVLNTAKQGLTVTGNQTTVTYASSDQTVATVTDDGKVTPLKAGNVIITATAVETENYKSATDEYTLKITDPNAVVEPTVVLSEEFDNASTADSNSAITSSTFSNFSGETAKAYQSQYGGIKLGTGSAVGYITSKALDLSSSFTVKLNVLKYGSDSGMVLVTVGNVTKDITPTDIDTEYTLEFEAASANATVKIGTSAKRAYIDNVVITRY